MIYNTLKFLKTHTMTTVNLHQQTVTVQLIVYTSDLASHLGTYLYNSCPSRNTLFQPGDETSEVLEVIPRWLKNKHRYICTGGNGL